LAHSSPASGQLTQFSFVFDGRILIPLQINESDPMDIILDTGIGQQALILMHTETGEELGLTYIRTVPGARGAGSGENKLIHLTAGEHLTLPGLDLGMLTTAVLDESRKVSGFHNVGVMGSALFQPYVVEIDFEESLITVYDPESFVPEEEWEEIPLDFGSNLPILETTLRIDGGGEIPVRLIIDTGGKPTLTLTMDADRAILPPTRIVHSLAGTGLRGDIYADHGRISELKVGNFALTDVVSSFLTGDEVPILEEINADGAIGLAFLYRFNLIFDFAHRRMLIKPNKFFSDPFELNMAGMVIEGTPSGNQVVYYVIEDSEAARKGLLKGDVLEEIDGRGIDSFGYMELKKVFEREGATVAVTIRRDGESRVVNLRLEKIL